MVKDKMGKTRSIHVQEEKRIQYLNWKRWGLSTWKLGRKE